MSAKILCGALLFTACSSSGGLSLDQIRADRAEVLADLKTFTVADLTAAGELAKAAGHLAGATCWPALAKVAASLQTQSKPTLLGVATLAETIWQAKHPGPRDETMIVACSALALQFTRDIMTDAIGIAKAYSSGGTSLVADLPKIVRVLTAIKRAAESGGGLGP